MLTQYLFIACFLVYKTSVFPPGEYVLHDRGAVDGYDIIQGQQALIPAPIADQKCVAISPIQASLLIQSLRNRERCEMEFSIITCEKSRGTWTF